MPEGVRIFLIVLVNIFAFGAIIAFALFMVIFPLINKFKNKNLPSYDYSQNYKGGEADFFDALLTIEYKTQSQKQKTKQPKEQSKEQKKTEPQKAEQPKKTEPQKAEQPQKTEPQKQEQPKKPEQPKKTVQKKTTQVRTEAQKKEQQKTEPPKQQSTEKNGTVPKKRAARIDYHKDVPTFILPPVENDYKEKGLTQTKINSQAKKKASPKIT